MESKTWYLGASEPWEQRYPLTDADTQLATRYVRNTFIYTADETVGYHTEKGKELIKRLQTGLVSLLKHPSKEVIAYPQMLGQVVNPPGELAYVQVNKDSAVPFTAANRTDLDIDQYHVNGRIQEQCLRTPPVYGGVELEDILAMPGGPPNLIVLVNFIRGGYIVCVQINHKIADGYGFAGFFRRWFQRTREGPDADAKETDGLRLHDKTEITKKVKTDPDSKWHRRLDESYHTVRHPKANPLVLGEDSNMISRVFWIRPEKVEAMREEIGQYTFNKPSVFASIVGVLYGAVLRARCVDKVLEKDQMGKAMTIMDIRTRLTPKMDVQYFGNAVTSTSVSTLVSQANNLEFAGSMAQRITDGLKAMTDEGIRYTMHYVSEKLRDKATGVPLDLFGFDMLFNSWEHLYKSEQELELGIGDFAASRGVTAPIPSYMLVLPAYGKRHWTPPATDANGNPRSKFAYPGGMEVQVVLRASEIEYLKTDPEWSKWFELV